MLPLPDTVQVPGIRLNVVNVCPLIAKVPAVNVMDVAVEVNAKASESVYVPVAFSVAAVQVLVPDATASPDPRSASVPVKLKVLPQFTDTEP